MLRGAFKEYGWCQHCYREMQALMKSAAFYENHPELMFPTKPEAKPAETEGGE